MTEYDEARSWAEGRGFDTYDLAARVGYSYEAVYWFLRGCTPPMRNAKSGSRSRKIKPNVWKRFKLACAAVEHECKTGKKFNW